MFVDLEFTNLSWTGYSEPLWVGLARDDGTSYSAINADVSLEHASQFVLDVVVPKIGPGDSTFPGLRRFRACEKDAVPDTLCQTCVKHAILGTCTKSRRVQSQRTGTPPPTVMISSLALQNLAPGSRSCSRSVDAPVELNTDRLLSMRDCSFKDHAIILN